VFRLGMTWMDPKLHYTKSTACAAIENIGCRPWTPKPSTLKNVHRVLNLEPLSMIRSMLTEVEGMCEELSQRKTELEKEIDGVRSERDALSTGKAEVEASLKIAGEKLAVSEKSAEGLRTANDGLQSDLDEAEQQVNPKTDARIHKIFDCICRATSTRSSSR
jgi:hypothetical protein